MDFSNFSSDSLHSPASHTDKNVIVVITVITKEHFILASAKIDENEVDQKTGNCFLHQVLASWNYVKLVKNFIHESYQELKSYATYDFQEKP